MGTCMARCWPPPFLDPRSYQPVRSRYLPDQDTIQLELIDSQVTDVRSTQSSCSLSQFLARLCNKVDKEEELELTTPQHYRPRRSTMRSITLGSLVSLTEPESPITNSIDLEWEPEAGLGNCGQRSPTERESSTQLSASNTADTGSWVPRSACSTPNSLEWDFRASTLSLRGAEGEGGWQQQRHRQDAETEQLLYEIEQLAARALADTGHGLAPDATNQQDHTNR
ncbi:unnamed protein product [Meganyctiphanes norvegica]|uniref:Uncharacterized protein n=1 Tax=Meganyctiphanes norvegica TaxID=48144 RepID=A0AAV2Q157_MEGNR